MSTIFFWTSILDTPKGIWDLDGPAIRNANRGDSRESIRRIKKKLFQIAWNLQFAMF